jgi:hypothetical protein
MGRHAKRRLEYGNEAIYLHRLISAFSVDNMRSQEWIDEVSRLATELRNMLLNPITIEQADQAKLTMEKLRGLLSDDKSGNGNAAG